MEHFELFGGKFFAKREAQKRLLALADQQTALDRRDLKYVLGGLLENAPGKRTLEWAGDHTISGDWTVDRNQEWVKDNGIAAIVCFGNLTVEGDLLSLDWEHWPLLIVAGDLRVRNLLKGGMPLFVFGNLLATGYFVTEYNDGLLRVGGDLVAAGYTPRCRDFPEAKGHVIAGSVRARTFDMRDPDVDRRHHRATFVAEVITEGWLDPGLILEREHEGLPVWKDQPDPILPIEPVLPPPMPAVSSVDPTGFGTLSGAREVKDGGGWIATNRFAGWVIGDPFRYGLDGKVLILPAGTHLPGDLELEWHADWVQRSGIVCIACEGDLTLDGDLLNLEGDSGPILLVGGRLQVRNLIAGGSNVIVLGDLEASGLVIGHYNHGKLVVGSDLSAQAYFVLDHSQDVYGTIHAPVLDEREVDLRDELVPELFEDEDATSPEAVWLWARQRAGLPVLKSETE